MDTIERINRLIPLIKDPWLLCEFMGRSEREYMVCETIHAAALNFKTYGDGFSFRGNGVFSDGGGGLFDNGSAYHWLVREGYFVESTFRGKGEHRGKPIIYPTDKLLDALDDFFATEDRRDYWKRKGVTR